MTDDARAAKTCDIEGCDEPAEATPVGIAERAGVSLPVYACVGHAESVRAGTLAMVSPPARLGSVETVDGVAYVETPCRSCSAPMSVAKVALVAAPADWPRCVSCMTADTSNGDARRQTRPSAILGRPDPSAPVSAASVAELVYEALSRARHRRDVENPSSDERRELSIFITLAEDAITRHNKAVYLRRGVFAITDAERGA